MNNSQYEMPNQEFIRNSIESIVGIKVNEIPSQQLTQMIMQQTQEFEFSGSELDEAKRSEAISPRNSIYIVPKAEVISGLEPSHIEQDTILSLAYALLDSIVENYELYHQDPAFALVYKSNSKQKSAKLFLFSKSDINALYYNQNRDKRSQQTKLYVYKVAAKSVSKKSSVH